MQKPVSRCDLSVIRLAIVLKFVETVFTTLPFFDIMTELT